MRDDTKDWRRRIRLAKQGASPLRKDEQEARETVRELGEDFLRDKTTAAEERKLRNALSLLRRREKISEREMRLRARRGWTA